MNCALRKAGRASSDNFENASVIIKTGIYMDDSQKSVNIFKLTNFLWSSKKKMPRTGGFLIEEVDEHRLSNLSI